jgi:organic radical activating enzyme
MLIVVHNIFDILFQKLTPIVRLNSLFLFVHNKGFNTCFPNNITITICNKTSIKNLLFFPKSKKAFKLKDSFQMICNIVKSLKQKKIISPIQALSGQYSDIVLYVFIVQLFV